MKILLMAMPDIHPFFRTWKAMTPSLALSSIAGNLNKKHVVHIADLVLKRRDVRGAVLAAVRKTGPDVVGLSAMSFQYDTALKIAKMLKGADPRIKIAIGGYHATLVYESIAASGDSKYFDFILRGESDKSFGELVGCLEDAHPLDSVDGLSYRKNGVFVHNRPRALEELGGLEFPDRKARLWKGYHFFGTPFDTIESSRGCVLRCSFCSIRQMYGNSFRKYDVSRVIEDIRRAKEAGARCLFFTDDNITLDVRRFEGLIDRIIESGHNNLTYVIQASTAGICSSAELAKKMAKGGFRFVFLGIESFSGSNLSTLKKGNIREKSIEAIRMLRANDVQVTGGLIIGNPDDTPASIEENYKFAKSLGVSTIYDQILTPYLKTEIRDELIGQNLVTNRDNFRLYNGHFANVRTKHLSSEDLDLIKYKMVQKYSPTFLEGAIKWRKTVLRHYLWFVLKLAPFGIVNYVSTLIKKLYLNDEKFFQRDYKRCVSENIFNLS